MYKMRKNDLQFFSSSFQHHNLFKRTVALTQSYQRENSLISDKMRSQGKMIVSDLPYFSISNLGENAFTCWAFSSTTMLRTSCTLLIESCFEHQLINNLQRLDCLKYIRQDKVHVETRNLIMMLLLPRKLHMDDQTQGAYLRAAVSRVRL